MDRGPHARKQMAEALTFTGGLLLSIPLALLAVQGTIWLAVALAAVGGPALAWMHEHL